MGPWHISQLVSKLRMMNSESRSSKTSIIDIFLDTLEAGCQICFYFSCMCVQNFIFCCITISMLLTFFRYSVVCECCSVEYFLYILLNQT